MKIHDLSQGSAEWLAYRAQHFNASDAPAMMGCSPYKTRADLLRELHTGMAVDVDASTQSLFDAGHRFEAMARPLAESIIGEDLYPCVGSTGRLSASFDGLTLGEDIVFEHKSANAELRAVMTGENCGPSLPLHYRVQMEQQLMVSGAGRALFMATLWDGEQCTFSRHCWYEPDEELRAGILRGWDQFSADLAAYSLPDAAEPAPIGRAPDTLPALRIEVTGQVTASNLAEFKQTALATIRAVNRQLTTDQDFADAEKAVKWCSDVEARLKAAKEHALSQTASIDALFKALDDIGSEARTVRLDLDKIIARRKVEIKEGAVVAARRALDEHIEALNAEIAPMRLPAIAADFAGCIKGLKSVASMQDKLDVLLAITKIEADLEARAIRANVSHFHAQAAGFEFLFADLGQIVHKADDDFAALVSSRIAAHKSAEAEREAKRQAEEAARIAAAEQRAREQEAARIADQQCQQASAPAPVQPIASQPPQPARAPLSPAAAAAHLKLGTICERLGFTVSAKFVSDVLGVKPACTDGRAILYLESQWPAICRNLKMHIDTVAERNLETV
jgi:putative phage-type endonuclease